MPASRDLLGSPSTVTAPPATPASAEGTSNLFGGLVMALGTPPVLHNGPPAIAVSPTVAAVGQPPLYALDADLFGGSAVPTAPGQGTMPANGYANMAGAGRAQPGVIAQQLN